MKLLIYFSFILFLSSFATDTYGQIQIFNANSGNANAISLQSNLVGTWKISNIVCENNVRPNSDIQKLLLNTISFSEFSLSANGNYIFSAKQSADCSLVSTGTYSVRDSKLVIRINQTNSQCGSSGGQTADQSVDFQLHGDELWLYQPAGYLKGHLCGVETRAIQILKRKDTKQ